MVTNLFKLEQFSSRERPVENVARHIMLSIGQTITQLKGMF